VVVGHVEEVNHLDFLTTGGWEQQVELGNLTDSWRRVEKVLGLAENKSYHSTRPDPQPERLRVWKESPGSPEYLS